MGRKLFVGNLPFNTGEPDLQDLFSQAGGVDSVRVMRDQATGRARGFAFVEMESDEAAQQAIDKFNQYELGGRAINVNEARPQGSGGPGGGDRFRGGGAGRRPSGGG